MLLKVCFEIAVKFWREVAFIITHKKFLNQMLNRSNILQPSMAQNCGGSADFATNLCQALLTTTSSDNNARMNAENYIKQASMQDGCLSNLLQIATNQQVSTF